MKCWTKHLHRTRCDGVDIKQWYSLFSVSPIIVQAKKKISMLRPGVFDHKWPWINMSASNIIWVKWIKTPFFCTITPLYVCNQHFHISKSLNTLRAASFTSVWDWLIEFSVSRVLNVILTKNSDISNIQGQKSEMYKTAPVSTTLYGGFNLKSLHWAWGTSYHGSSTAINLSPTWCNRLPPAPLSYIQCHSIFISVSLSTAFSLTCINIATFISFLVLNSSFLRAPTGPQQRTLMLSETNKTNLLGVQPHWVKKK